MNVRLTGTALVFALAIGAPAWGQAPKSTAPGPAPAVQQEPASQLVPDALPPFSPRLDAAVAVPNPGQAAQPTSQIEDGATVDASIDGVPPDDPKKINENNRKNRERHGVEDSAADLNRQELSRITSGGGYYRARGY